jgi:dihydrofolate synthase/folylpolyglutamate synthase
MLAAILQTAGYKTGLYTSPHLYDFRERIRINGQMVREQYITQFVSKHQELIESIDPSFFEVTVAMAFDHFAEEQVEVAVIETGLGGRLDSTNIITPVLSLITNIGYDHMNILGNTLEAIASEKAGIIKRGIPVVIGEKNPLTASVFNDKATLEHAPIHFAEDHYRAKHYNAKFKDLEVQVENSASLTTATYQLDLPGHYQLKNLLGVLTALDLLKDRGFPVSVEHRREGLSQVIRSTGLRGRWEQLRSSPTVVIDVAHNPDGIREVIRQLQQTPHEQLHWILGMVKDKAVEKVLELLPKEACYYFTKAQLPRALDENELFNKASEIGLSGLPFSDVNQALQHALQQAGEKDLILVCGSVFIAGELERNGMFS